MQSLYYVQYNQPSRSSFAGPVSRAIKSSVGREPRTPRATSAILQKTNNGENRRAASCLSYSTVSNIAHKPNPARPNPILCCTGLRGSESHWIAVSGRLHIPLLTPLGRSLREFDVLENLLISSVVKVLARISGRNCVDTTAAELNELGTTLPAVVPRGSSEKDMRLG